MEEEVASIDLCFLIDLDIFPQLFFFSQFVCETAATTGEATTGIVGETTTATGTAGATTAGTLGATMTGTTTGPLDNDDDDKDNKVPFKRFSLLLALSISSSFVFTIASFKSFGGRDPTTSAAPGNVAATIASFTAIFFLLFVPRMLEISGFNHSSNFISTYFPRLEVPFNHRLNVDCAHPMILDTVPVFRRII